jgi:dTDP-glucose 4,6-dehydratase/UDP-glucose 4,6-dehydratase
MKNILVTGGCGFIGSNFLNYMVSKYPNCNFINLDAMYYCASIDNLTIRNYNNYHFVRGNLNSVDLINYILTENNIDTIFHFAAQSHVDNSFSNPLQYTQDNIVGTHNLLECVRGYNKIEKFIHISTDEVYGEADEHKTENSILCPTNPYAATKAAAEMLVKSYIYSYKLPIITVRMNNVFGPNQYPEKLIPKFIKLLKEGKKCTIHGNGSTRRIFVHTSDVCRAIELIGEKGVLNEIYNIGGLPENEHSVLEITQMLVNKYFPGDSLEQHITFVRDRDFNDKRYLVNDDKIKQLGWEPYISLRDYISQIE